MSAGPDGSDDVPEGGPAPDDAPAPKRELRGKDLLTRSEAELAELEANLDPTELAELSSWFARPSREVVEEKIREVLEGSDEDLDRKADERQVRVAEASKAIEARTIALLERHAETAARIRRIEGPPPFVDESIFQIRVRPAEEDAQIGELRSYERDREIDDALGQSVPQAVLRDLYRMEEDFEIRFTSPFFEEAAPEDPWIELRAVMRERHLMPAPLTTYQTGAEAKREFRTLIEGSWADKHAAVKAAKGES